MIQEIDTEYEGAFGKYKITIEDQYEVKKYRIAIFICGLSFLFGVTQWMIIGPVFAYLWLVPMIISLGLALKWIHIYIRFIHVSLQLFWLIGLIGIISLSILVGPNNFLEEISNKPILILMIGPFFAALTGLGFKEYFCFKRPEAIGLTLVLPITLICHLFSILNHSLSISFLLFSAFLLFILSVRKFGLSPALDIGDKSVFEYLKKTSNPVNL